MKLPTALYEFHWDSVSDERKRQILDWLATLTDDQKEMISEIVLDREIQDEYDS